MRSRRGTTTAHQEAVERRLSQLAAELAATRAEPGPTVVPAAERPRAAGAEEAEWWRDHTRVATDRPDLSVVPDPTPHRPPAHFSSYPDPEPETEPIALPPAIRVPHPGRHADRRGPGWQPSDLLPDTLRGRIALGAGQLTVVALLIAVGLAITTWWVIRGDPQPPQPVAAQTDRSTAAPGVRELPEDGAAEVPSDTQGTAGTDGAGSGAGTVDAASPTGELTVDVAGKVRRPGIAVLEAGSRVIDALKAAGGAKPGVDLTSLNLARPLVDGEQILVGVAGGPAPTAPDSSGSTSGDPATGTLVNINTATDEQLDTLPEVGPVTAGSIIAWREEHGGFSSIDELLEVDGIGEATLAKLQPYVTV